MGRLPASLLAPAATAQLGLLLAWAACSPPPAQHASTLLGVLAAVALLSAARMGTAHCMESRVVATAVGVLTLVGVVLTSTVGLPGSSARPVDPPAVLLAVVAAAAVALVVVPEPRPSADRAPYAS